MEKPKSVLVFGATESYISHLGPLISLHADIVAAGFGDLSFDLMPGMADIRERISGSVLDAFHLVVFRRLVNCASVLGALTSHLETYSIPFIGKHASQIRIPNKLFQYTKFAHHDLPFPRSIYLSSQKWMSESYGGIISELGSPFILKPIESSQGRHNYLIADEFEFCRLVVDPEAASLRFVAQRYVRNESREDIRVLVIGGAPVFAMKRRSQHDSHITNTSAGGIATRIDLATVDPEAITYAQRAAAILGQDVAGVDLIQDSSSGAWFVLESNCSPAITEGAFIDSKVDAYASFLLRRLRHGAERALLGEDLRQGDEGKGRIEWRWGALRGSAGSPGSRVG